MRVDDIRFAVALIKYKPGTSIELAPVAGRLFDPEAGKLSLIIRITTVDALDPKQIVTKTNTRELPPANFIRDRLDVLRLVRNAIQDVERFESDQWFELDGKFPYRRTSVTPIP